MRRAYLEVTYRQGRPLAAYYYLPRPDGVHSHATRKAADGLLVDFDETGRAIGIEITAPGRISAAALNGVLAELGHAPLSDQAAAPLHAA